jgi:hypothetical protein
MAKSYAQGRKGKSEAGQKRKGGTSSNDGTSSADPANKKQCISEASELEVKVVCKIGNSGDDLVSYLNKKMKEFLLIDEEEGDAIKSWKQVAEFRKKVHFVLEMNSCLLAERICYLHRMKGNHKTELGITRMAPSMDQKYPGFDQFLLYRSTQVFLYDFPRDTNVKDIIPMLNKTMKEKGLVDESIKSAILHQKLDRRTGYLSLTMANESLVEPLASLKEIEVSNIGLMRLGKEPFAGDYAFVNVKVEFPKALMVKSNEEIMAFVNKKMMRKNNLQAVIWCYGGGRNRVLQMASPEMADKAVSLNRILWGDESDGNYVNLKRHEDFVKSSSKSATTTATTTTSSPPTTTE